MKILGMTFDQKLTWKGHIKNHKQNATKLIKHHENSSAH